ncbi:MAG TPA: hypothetical protein DDW41_01615 [Candidatus Andersenbacteria bacterium]|nr:hypothetical protein [Candidatus Andersenbacteria bacterium]
MRQSTTFPPAFAKATAGRQSRITHRSLATAAGSLQPSLPPSLNLPDGRQGYGGQGKLWPAGNWKSRISTHIERDLAKLFLDGA